MASDLCRARTPSVGPVARPAKLGRGRFIFRCWRRPVRSTASTPTGSSAQNASGPAASSQRSEVARRGGQHPAGQRQPRPAQCLPASLRRDRWHLVAANEITESRLGAILVLPGCVDDPPGSRGLAELRQPVLRVLEVVGVVVGACQRLKAAVGEEAQAGLPEVLVPARDDDALGHVLPGPREVALDNEILTVGVVAEVQHVGPDLVVCAIGLTPAWRGASASGSPPAPSGGDDAIFTLCEVPLLEGPTKGLL